MGAVRSDSEHDPRKEGLCDTLQNDIVSPQLSVSRTKRPFQRWRPTSALPTPGWAKGPRGEERQRRLEFRRVFPERRAGGGLGFTL